MTAVHGVARRDFPPESPSVCGAPCGLCTRCWGLGGGEHDVLRRVRREDQEAAGKSAALEGGTGASTRPTLPEGSEPLPVLPALPRRQGVLTEGALQTLGAGGTPHAASGHARAPQGLANALETEADGRKQGKSFTF